MGTRHILAEHFPSVGSYGRHKTDFWEQCHLEQPLELACGQGPLSAAMSTISRMVSCGC
jgi:hypothetical protein